VTVSELIERLQPVPADFAGAIKGKRSLASMQDALDATLAAAKITADTQGRAIRANVAHFQKTTEGMEHLFADLGVLVHKSADDFEAVLASRIGKYLDMAAAQEKQRQADEAARIAAAEQRAREQEAARIAAAQAESARLEALAASNRAALAAQDTARQGSQQVLKAEPATADATDRETPANTSPRGGAMGAGQAAAAAPAVERDEPATLTLGMICERLQFTVRADFLADVLHIKPAATQGRAVLYRESQFATICAQLVSHVSAMAELYAGETA
jgi:hypothetical protein